MDYRQASGAASPCLQDVVQKGRLACDSAIAIPMRGCVVVQGLAMWIHVEVSILSWGYPQIIHL